MQTENYDKENFYAILFMQLSIILLLYKNIITSLNHGKVPYLVPDSTIPVRYLARYHSSKTYNIFMRLLLFVLLLLFLCFENTLENTR